MRVIAVKSGYYKGLRAPREEFDWPELDDEGAVMPPWVREARPRPQEEGRAEAKKPADAAKAPAPLPDALSDGTRLDNFANRHAIREYAEKTFGSTVGWGTTSVMLAELVALDAAAVDGD